MEQSMYNSPEKPELKLKEIASDNRCHKSGIRHREIRTTLISDNTRVYKEGLLGADREYWLDPAQSEGTYQNTWQQIISDLDV